MHRGACLPEELRVRAMTSGQRRSPQPSNRKRRDSAPRGHELAGVAARVTGVVAQVVPLGAEKRAAEGAEEVAAAEAAAVGKGGAAEMGLEAEVVVAEAATSAGLVAVASSLRVEGEA